MSQPALLARFALRRESFALAVDLQLPGQGVSAIFGPSGSGKTTLLRCIAGLEKPDEGTLHMAGQCWFDSRAGIYVPAHKRAIGYVFQEANLLPHLDVQGNLRYGLKRTPADQRKVALEHALELLGIEHLLKRRVQQLSGGESQRVAIARALLTSPRLLLMDEPLASLDYKRKAEVLPYLQRLHQELDIAVLYVSHAADEVARLADYLVLLENGAVQGSGPLKECLLRHDLPFALDDDAEAVIDGVASASRPEYGLIDLKLPGSQAQLHLLHSPLPIAHPVRVKIKARDVSLSLQRAEHSSLLNLLPVHVHSWQHLDHQSVLTLRLGEQRLLARISRYSFEQMAISQGQALWAQIKSVSLLAP